VITRRHIYWTTERPLMFDLRLKPHLMVGCGKISVKFFVNHEFGIGFKKMCPSLCSLVCSFLFYVVGACERFVRADT